MVTISKSLMRVLIVEDEPDYSKLLASLFNKWGFSTSCAYDGEEALLSAKCNPPDLITLDINMPPKTGLSFYINMKTVGDLRDVPVIIITGLAQARDIDDLSTRIKSVLESKGLPPPDAYIVKPIDNRILLDIVNTLLDITAVQ